MAKQRPVKSFRVGFVKAAVWEGESGFYNVTVQRTYKDDDGLKNTQSFGHGDLLNVAKVMTRAERWIAEQQSAE